MTEPKAGDWKQSGLLSKEAVEKMQTPECVAAERKAQQTIENLDSLNRYQEEVRYKAVLDGGKPPTKDIEHIGKLEKILARDGEVVKEKCGVSGADLMNGARYDLERSKNFHNPHRVEEKPSPLSRHPSAG